MTPAEFKGKLKKKEIQPLSLFIGEASYGFEELISLLQDSYLDRSNFDFNFQQFACREADMETVLNAARTYPFLAAKRLLLLRNLHELSSGGQDTLAEYLQNPAPETLLVMTAERLDNKGALKKLLQKHADWVEFKKLRDYQVPDLVRKKAAEKGRRFSKEALELFCHRGGTDMRRLQGEMDKLFQFLGERKNIEVEDVVNSSSEGGEASIFDLLNALGRRRVANALVCLQEQLEERVAPQFILTMITRHFRQLWTIRALRKQGLDKTVISGKVGINRFFYDTMQEQADNYSVAEMRQVFELLLETDKLLKTTGCNCAPVLESFFCRLMGRKELGGFGACHKNGLN